MSKDSSLHRSTLLIAVLSFLSAAAFAQVDERSFSFSCGSGISLDLPSNRSVCRDALISNGEVDISADQGTGTDFDDSEWSFDGNVRIAFDSTIMEADRATFAFMANELISGELSGDPVVLEDFIPDENVQVRVTAQAVSYDNRDGTVKMEGEVSFIQGTRELSGCDLVYNFRDKLVQLGSSECAVRVIIRPQEGSSSRDSPEDR